MALNNLGLGFLFTAKDLASGVMSDVKKRLLEVEGAGKEAVKALGESFKQFGAGLGLMGVGIAGLAMLDPAVEAAGDFSQALKLITTRVSESEFPMEEMRGQIDDLALKFGIMPVDEAKAMYDAVAAGARDAASAQALMTAANQIAIGTQTDLHSSLAAVSQVAKVFNIALTDSTKVADALFVASKHVEGGVTELSGMLEHIGPIAATAGMSFDELLGSLAQLEASGMRGRPAMAGMKAILDSMIKPTADAKGEAARLGIAFDEASVQAKGLPAILNEINDSGRMNSHTLERLFGSTEAATAAMALMRNGGADLNKMMGELAAGTGAAASAAEKMVTAKARFKVLQDQVLTLIGEALLPMRSKIYQVLNAILEGFTKISPGVIKFFTLLFAGVAILATVAGGAAALGAAFTILSTVAGILGVTVGGVAASIWAALWPVVLIAGIVALAIYGLKLAFDSNFGGIADTAKTVWEDLKLVFTALDELFSGGGFTEDTWQKLEKHSGIRDFAISVFGWVGRIENFFGGIGRGFEKSVGVLRPIFDAISVAIDSLVDAFGMLSGPQGAEGAANAFDAFGVAGEGLGATLTAVFGFLLGVFQWVLAAVRLVVVGVVGGIDILKSLFSGLIDFFYGFFEFFAELVQGHWGKAWHGMKMMVFGVVDAIIGILMSLVSVVGGIVDTIAGLLGKKTSWQKDIAAFRDTMHNEMAKDMGVAGGTGLRPDQRQSASGMGGVAVGGLQPGEIPLASGLRPQGDAGPVASVGPAASFALPANVSPWSAAGGARREDLASQAMPALAAAGGEPGPGEGADLGTMTSHLEQISRNTEGGPPINVNVMLDSDVIGKAVTKARKNDETRNYTPAPVPG